MDPINLNDYRCDCGKLLFKGLFLRCCLEIKCKKCGKIKTFKYDFSNQSHISFEVSVDKKEIITGICFDAEVLLGYPREEIIGKSILDICPVLRDELLRKELKDSISLGKSYNIKNNLFVVCDGNTFLTESFCVGNNQKDSLGGYKIFNSLTDNNIKK